MAANIELYELLKDRIGPDAARKLSEAMPERDEVVTVPILDAKLAELRAEFAELKADIRGWMLSFFVPLWIGVYGTLIAVVVTGLNR